MKSYLTVGIIVAAIGFMPAAAQAETPEGWYVGMNTNMVFAPESDSEVSGVTNVIEYKDGWGISGYSGYAFGNGLRTEGELTYRHSSANDITGTGSGTAGGGIHNLSVMANVLYDYDMGYRVTPYIGAGVGIARVGADNLRTISGDTFDSNEYAFAYQGIVGFSLDLEGAWSFNADYRYVATPDVDFSSRAGGTSAKTQNASHNLMMGIRYQFEAEKEPEPAPKPAPAPKPVPKPIPRLILTPVQPPVIPQMDVPVIEPIRQSYMVFFDFDKSIITPEAQRVIATAARDFRRGHYVRLVITGHTDTMGTNAYNEALSQRRSTAVREAFMAEGMGADEIEMRASGERELYVPTNDQVREVQNRRAEILFIE